MKVGTIKEVKDNEGRVGLTPDNVALLVKSNNQIFVQTGAGVAAGYSDQEYYLALIQHGLRYL